MSLFDDNLEWVQPGESTISGIYRGKGEFGEYLGRLAEKAVAVRALSFMADGDTVVAFKEVTAGSEMGEDADVYMLRGIASGPRRGREEAHATAVVSYHASPVRSQTVRVCLVCLWVSADLDAEHG